MEKKQEVYALEVLRETLQRFYDAVYPFDEAIGCRDLPTLAPNDIDSLRFNWDDFADAIPDFGNVCDAAVQLLAIGNREAMRRRLAELKGAIIDFGRAHKAMIDAGKTEYAARCGEANAEYERIRDLTEAALGVVDGLLTQIGGAATSSAAMLPTKKQGNRRAFSQARMAKACGVDRRTIINWENGTTLPPATWDGEHGVFLRYSPELRDDPIKAQVFGMWYKIERDNANKIRKTRA